MAIHALRYPEGIASFEEVAGKGGKVAIIVDDGTRPTPVSQILDVVLQELDELGVPPDRTTIVVGLGTHERLSEATLRARLGADVVSRYQVVQHDARQGDFMTVEVPGRRKEVRINRKVLEADVRIGIGSVLPHPMAGFGGGPKLIMPAVADLASIVEHHMTLTVDPKSAYGEITGNPFHGDCMMVAKRVGLDFLINCVYDLQGRMSRIVGGAVEQAFKKAVESSIEEMGLEFDEKVDVTITSTYPHVHGLQMFKGLNGPDAITKENGAILMMAPLKAPFPESFIEILNSIKRESGGKALAYATGHMATGKPFVPEKSAEFNMAMYDLLRRPPIRTILVSPSISRETATGLGLEYAVSIEEGLRVLKEAYPVATAAIFPAGGLVLPRKRQPRP